MKKIAFLTTIMVTLLIITGCNLRQPQILTRPAVNNDIDIDLSQQFSININYDFTARKDIVDLEITFKYYDKNYKLLTTKIKRIGNVTKNTTYTVSVSLSEFSFTQIFSIVYSSADVTGGTVSLI